MIPQITPVGPAAAATLAGLTDPMNGDWSAADYAPLLASAAHLALLLQLEGAAAGFCLAMLTADEAELIQISIDPAYRRRGLGRRLLSALSDHAVARAERLLLEVAADNAPALALYRAAGFLEIGRRPRYYKRGADALMLAAPLPLCFREPA